MMKRSLTLCVTMPILPIMLPPISHSHEKPASVCCGAGATGIEATGAGDFAAAGVAFAATAGASAFCAVTVGMLTCWRFARSSSERRLNTCPSRAAILFSKLSRSGCDIRAGRGSWLESQSK